MGCTDEKVAGFAHSPKGIYHRGPRLLVHQVIGAYLCNDGEHIHLRRGGTNRTKDFFHAIDDIIIKPEENLDIRPELYLRGELRVKHWMPKALFVHIVMCPINVLKRVSLLIESKQPLFQSPLS